MPDWGYPLVLLSVVLVAGIAWAGRVALHGVPSFARVDQGGSSLLLGHHVQAMAYWALQPLGRGLAAVGVSADAVTWASLVLGLFAGAALAEGRFGLAALVGALSFLCDAVDGLIARLTGTASPAGEVLDAAIDRYVDFAWMGGLAVYFRGDGFSLGLVLAALLGAVSVSYVTAKAEAMQVTVPRGTMRRVERCVYLCLGAAITSFASLWPLPSSWQSTPHRLPPAWPMLAVLGLIAVVANVSAIRRQAALARAVRSR